MKVNDLILTLFISFTLIFFLGANFNPDSISYINDNKIRPPAYPLIINFFDFIFRNKSLIILAFFQVFFWIYASIFFWIYASIYFSIFLCKVFNIEDYNRYLFLLFLIIPINPIHQYGNTILTESLSYVGCIGVFINVYKIYLHHNKKYIFYLFLILLFALTLRHQMIFLNLSIIIFSYGLISFNDLIFLQPLIYFIGLLILIFYSYKIEKFTINLNFQNIREKFYIEIIYMF